MIFARDCASRSLRPDFLKIQSTISLITHPHCNRCIAASRVGSVNFGARFKGFGQREEQLSAGNSQVNWPEDEFYACSDGEALPSGFRPWGVGCLRAGRYRRSRPSIRDGPLRGMAGDARRNRDKSRSPRRTFEIGCNQANRRRGFGFGCVSIVRLS